MSIVVSIGRNIGTEPMSAEQWKAFRARLDSAVRFNAETAGGQVVFSGSGIGQWNGRYEESFTIITTDAALRELRADLRWLAYLYSQDAIALTVADPEFVTPETRTANDCPFEAIGSLHYDPERDSLS